MLRIWLPLNGDLRNQGLDDITVTNNGATYSSTGGKLGGCYNFDGDDCIDTGYKENFGTGDFSIAAWVKITSSSKTYQPIVSNKSTGAASVGCAIYFNHNQNKFLWSTADGSSSTEIWSTNTFSDIYDKWTHVVMVRNSSDSRKGYFYINGERQEIASVPAIRNVTNNACNITIGGLGTGRAASYYWTGGICDVRLYDHALSAKEASELAKGLVLHYRLSGIGGENLATNTDFSLNSTEGYLGYKAVEYNHSDWTSGGRFFVGYNYSQLTFTEIQANQPYTISAWVYIYDDVSLSNGASIFYRVYKTKESPTYSNDIHISLDNITERNKWIRLSDTFISSATYTYDQGGTFSIGGYNGHFLVSMPKIEKGLKPTPWCPNKNDELYSIMGLDDGIEYDTSGFQNNGTQTGTITWNSDSARYNSCYEMTGTSYINCGKPYDYIVDGSEEFTINIWAYKDTWDTSTQIYSCTESGGFSLSTGNNSISCYCHVYRDSSILTNSSGATITNSSGDPILLSTSSSYIAFTQSYILSPEWHMFTMVYTKQGLKLYVDGSLARNSESSSIGIHYNLNCNLFIGAEATGAGGCSSPYLNGKASDFRIFAKALDADAILALYRLAGSLDSNGTFHTYEYVEV